LYSYMNKLRPEWLKRRLLKSKHRLRERKHSKSKRLKMLRLGDLRGCSTNS